MNTNESELTDALKDAVRWLDAIEQRLGLEMVNLMPNNCLGRPAMLQIIDRMEKLEEREPEPAGSRDRDEWRHEAAAAQGLK